MDRKPIIGFTLIFVIITAWMMYNSVKQQETVTKQQSSNQQVVSTTTSQNQAQTPTAHVQSASAQYGQIFQAALSAKSETIIIENELYRAEFNSRGATFTSWQLKNFKSWFGAPVQLVPASVWSGQFGLGFTTHDGKDVDTRNLTFSLVSPARDGKISLEGTQTAVVKATLQLPNGASVVKTFTFYGNVYDVDLGVQMNNMDQIIANRRYTLLWKDGVPYQERNSVDESNHAKAILSVAKTSEELDASSDFNKKIEMKNSGAIDYAAVKNKYFTAAILPQNPRPETDVYVEGIRYGAPDNGAVEQYDITFRMPVTASEDKFKLFVGPTDYKIVSKYGLEKTVDLGWKFIRLIGEYVMMPIFTLIHSFVPNYGLAILIFSILMKLALHPLTIGQTRSAIKMKMIAPEIEKVREKYKDDMQIQQQETMKIYQQYGINPVGGCLPLIVQMPVLYALYSLLSGSIALRQSAFLPFWITDLSIPDSIFHFPANLSLFGIHDISGLALLMAATMFIQQKMTITDPRQQATIYMMPVMFLLMFSALPAGLNLYYFMINIMGIAQQTYMTKTNKLTLADLKKTPAKEGFLAKKLREAQEIAAAQGRSLPGLDELQEQQRRNNNKKK